MPNILHVVNIYFVLPYFIGNQFDYFHKKGSHLYVVCSASPYLFTYSKEHSFEYLETKINRKISLKDDLKSIWAVCKYIRQKKISVIVGHTPKGALIAMISGFFMRTPQRIYFRHGLVYETSRGMKRFILKSIDRITSLCATKVVCVSPSVLKKSIEDKLAPDSKQLILGKGTCNGIDTQVKFNPEMIDSYKLNLLKKKWGILSTDQVIGYSGRLVKDKGIIELVEAFEQLARTNNHLKLLLVGMFEERDALPQAIQEKIKVDARIVWTDFINEDQQYFYAMMDLYVLPSYREGFPTGVLEAHSMGLPVLTTKNTGCCDSIIEEENGLFVDLNCKDLIYKIERILSNTDYQKTLGQQGRKWVVENFDNRVIWKELEKLYLK